jgi:hypothetical protein
MTKTSNVIAAMDRVLRPSGFGRNGKVWKRRFAGGFDVVSLQPSKSGEAYYINLGVLDPAIYERCWGHELPADFGEPSCTVRTRLSRQEDGRASELWRWDSPEEALVAALTTEGLAFLEQMHDRAEMESFLEATNVVRQRYPPPIIYLALLKELRGDLPQACDLLRDLAAKTMGVWKTKVADVIANLGC